MRSLAVATLVIAALGVESVARAQAGNAAIAEELFNDAKRLLDQGHADQACPKFAESLRLDPTLGTRLNLAHCYEVQGRTASAWGQYKEVARGAEATGDTKRGAIARDRIAALDPALPHVLISGSLDPGATISLDGEPLNAAIVGTTFPIDPGDHHLDISQDGKKPGSVTFHADKAQSQTVEIPALASATETQEAPPPVVEHPTQPVTPTTEVSQGKLIGGWVAIGGGVVALGLGITFGALTLSLASQVSSECPAGPCPTQQGINDNSTAHTFALLSDVLIPVGVVAAGLGTWLVLTASHRNKPAASTFAAMPYASPSGGGFAMVGRF